MKLKMPGLRIIKTGLAVFISLIVSHIRGGEAMPFYAAIAAIICLKEDVDGTLSIGINRIFGTLLGGAVGLLYLLAFKERDLPASLNYLLVSLSIVLMIWVMALLGKTKAISIMAVVFVSIAINHGLEAEYPVTFVINRVVDTLVGVFTAIIVNWSDFEIKKRMKRVKG